MQYRFLGKERLKVSAIGFGCPTFQGRLSDADEKRDIAIIHRAIDLGVNFIDTADHNDGNNEELLAKALKGKRRQVVLASKFGNLRGQPWPWAKGRDVDGSPEYVAKACEASLRRLQTDHLDLYYLHRVDPKVPVEDTVGAMTQLVEQGKIRHIGLSEAGPQTIRRAHAAYAIAAVQSEYSLWTRDYERDTIPTVKDLGIGFVSYYALGRGFFAGSIRSLSDLAEKDGRRKAPRFHAENFDHNARLLRDLEKIAQAKGITVAQVSLAWILHQGDRFVPIPGTRQIRHLEENVRAADIVLTADELAAVDKLFPQKGAAAGARHDYDRSKELNI
ncbi:MAG TPA: aldo/keto reductase [Candidatus Binatia bacterium]|jgi:aryl-alcohol dehydrogenase-like predicted oxidoreductase